MQVSELSSLDCRSFLRICQSLLQEEPSESMWNSIQKHLLLSSQPEFGFYLSQLKKIPREIRNDLRDGFSIGQVESKIWLTEVLQDVLHPRPYHFILLGSWFGLLPRMMRWMNPEFFHKIQCYDLDPRWEEHGTRLLKPDVWDKTVEFKTRDLFELDSQFYGSHDRSQLVVVNTVLEHLQDPQAWLASLPKGICVALQANDLVRDDHLSCPKNLEEFDKWTPLETTLFLGKHPLPSATRYMKIGITQ